MVQLLKTRKVKPLEGPASSAAVAGNQSRGNVTNTSNDSARGNPSTAYKPVVSRKILRPTTPGPPDCPDGPTRRRSAATASKSVAKTSMIDDSGSSGDDEAVLDKLSKSTVVSASRPGPACSKVASKNVPAPRSSRRSSGSVEGRMDVDEEEGGKSPKGVGCGKARGGNTRNQAADKRKSTESNASPTRRPIEKKSRRDQLDQAQPHPIINEEESSETENEFESDGNSQSRPQATASTVVSSSSPTPLSRRIRIIEMDVDEESGSSVSSLASPTRDRRSALGGNRFRDRVATSSLSVQESESGSSEESFDPNDPDWVKFCNLVKDSPASAHTRLSSDLMESSNSLALLGKLICRLFSVDAGTDCSEESKRLRDKYGVTIIRAILHLTVENDNRSSLVVDLGNMLFSELKHFSTLVLYNIAEYCLEYMKKDKDRDGCLPPRWIEIFGKIVSVLTTRGDIKHETDVLEGKAYKEYIVTEICSPRVDWTAENTASLLAIIREIPGLADTELKLLFVRIRSFLKKFKAAAIPPIVHQLILLAGSKCPSELLTICAEYFENVDFSNTESLEVRQKRNALGTVVFHFLEAARTCAVLLGAVIKVVKGSFFNFGEVMSPFMLSIVLGLTTYEHAKAVIVEPLRNSVMKSFHSLHLSEMSYWYRHKVGDAKDTVTPCFKAVLETKSSELEFMVDGLRELGIGLLNADLYQSKYPNTLERCQTLGSYLITSIVKSFPDQLSSMMKHLIKVSSRSLVHTECLAKCIEMRTRQIIHPSMLGITCELIRQLPMMECAAAAMIVKALSNALNLSYILLDQLMLHLRKTIWKSVEARKTAAKIMIILLSNSRVVGDIPFSQFSESQRFYESQNQNQQPSASTAGGQLPDNQPLCMEILTLAKRCFSQQCEIREELYLGFHSVVRKNPGLCELICSHLYKHTNQYFSDDADADSPAILFGKVIDLPTSTSSTSTTYTVATIQEELGFLVQCLSFVVHKSHQAFHAIDDGPPTAVENLEELLQQWIKAILKITPSSIEIAAADALTGAGGGSRPLDSVRYIETIFTIQIMQVIEALIEFLNLENKTGSDRTVKKLFERHSLLEPLLKREKEKPGNKKEKGKGDKGKTKGKATQKDKDVTSDEVTVIDDASSETSENPTSGVKFKKPDAPKRLFYYHIITLENALDMLRKLQKSDNDKGVVLLVDSIEFEKFLLSIVKQKMDSFKRKEPLHERSRPTQKILEIFADIAGCIWNGLLMHNSEEENGVQIVSSDIIESRLEIVNEIVTLLCSSHASVCSHLIKVFSDDDGEDSYEAVFPKFFNSWKAVHGWLPVSADGDKTVHQHLFDILRAFAIPLTPDTEEETRAIEVMNWVWNYMSLSSGNNGKAEFLLAESVVSCWLTYYMKGKDFLEQPGKSQHDVLTLARGVKQVLGVGDDVDTQHIQDSVQIKMWIINEDTVPTVLCSIMNQIEVILDHVTAVLGKLKFNQHDGPEIQNKIGLLRGACFAKIDEVVTVCSQLVISRFPACLCCNTMLKVIPQIFIVMTGFGEYISDLIKFKRPYSLKGFVKPMSKIGNHFKPLVEAMINHVERVQREYADEVLKNAVANKKYKGVAKVPQAVKNQLLKEKRLIPNFIYVIEKYDQLIISLSKKSDKIQLLAGMKLSTARDFRIDSKKLTEAMNSRTRSVQEMTTVPDEETHVDALNSSTSAGPPRTAPRQRKARKRKPSETEGDDEATNDE